MLHQVQAKIVRYEVTRVTCHEHHKDGSPDSMRVGHPAAKPIALFSELLRRSVRPADKVLDLFCGTGPIFGAAYQHKCLATGVELDKAYYGESLRQINLLED